MSLHPHKILALAILYLVAAGALGQQGPQVSKEELVDIQKVIRTGLRTVSTRSGERIVQDMQFRVTRRNNRRPVAAAFLIKAWTPSTGPSATFGRNGSHEAEYRTDANGEFTVQGLLTNDIAGSYELKIAVDFIDSDGTHYVGRAMVPLKNVKGGIPGWVKYVAIGAAGGVAICAGAGPCRPGGGPTTISFASTTSTVGSR
jgi:hypothetical protein